MSSHKHRRRAKRRAEQVIDQAWTALEEGHFALARKLAKRAVDQGPMNARFWKERAEILHRLQDDEEARCAARRALVLSPKYQEAEQLLETLGEKVTQPQTAVEVLPSAQTSSMTQRFTERTERFDWEVLGHALERKGAVRLPQLLTEKECGQLRASADFEHEVQMSAEQGGAAYRFFRRPFPSWLEALRAELYARLAPITNRWQAYFSAPEFPLHLDAFLAQCAHRGHRRSSLILLRYPPGSFNAFHRDLPGRIFFPIQCAVSLGPARKEAGGQFALVDVEPGRKKRTLELETDIGDAVLFCAHSRVRMIGGLPGLQPVMHGLRKVGSERYALGLPFHDYPGGPSLRGLYSVGRSADDP